MLFGAMMPALCLLVLAAGQSARAAGALDDALATIEAAGRHMSFTQAAARYNWSVWDQKERRWDANEARARPPKEEALWIRKGDETRNIPQSERMANAYKSAMGR